MSDWILMTRILSLINKDFHSRGCRTTASVSLQNRSVLFVCRQERASVCLDSVMKLKSYFDHMKVCKVKLTVDSIRHEDLQRADNFESVVQ